MSENLLRLIRHGHELLARERRVLSAGQFGEIAEITAQKQALLAALDQATAHTVGTTEVRRALAELIAESRHNERLIAAARTGFAIANRRIAAIVATRKGAVAYAPDGSQITSRADQESKTNRA